MTPTPNRPGRLPKQYVQAGDSWPGFTITIKDADGVPVDLTQAWTAWSAQFRPTRGTDEVVPLDVDASKANLGQISVSAGPVATRQMNGDGLFDVQATGIDGGVRTWVEGVIGWQQDVTR